MKKENFIWSAIKTGSLGGVISIYICLIGMVEVFSERDVIEKTLTLGQFVLLATGVFTGFVASRRTSSLLMQNKPQSTLLSGLTGGVTTGALLALLVLIGDKVNLLAVSSTHPQPLTSF